jgi:hypothetical protein
MMQIVYKPITKTQYQQVMEDKRQLGLVWRLKPKVNWLKTENYYDKKTHATC